MYGELNLSAWTCRFVEDSKACHARVHHIECFSQARIDRFPISNKDTNSTHSVAKCIADLFLEYGTGLFPMLRGAFAMCILDHHANKAYLLRDAMGEYPLLYHLNSQICRFSMHYAGLLDSGIASDLNADILSDYLWCNANNHQSTVYQQIQRIPPGHYLEINTDGTHSLKTYFRLEDIETEDLYPSFDDYANEFYSVIATAVTRRLQTHKQLGAHLSSGWDSTAVAVIAAQQMQQDELQTYTWQPDSTIVTTPSKYRFANEGKIAAHIAQSCHSMSNYAISCSDTSFLANSDAFIAKHRHPQLLSYNHTWYEAILGEAQSHQVDVMLTGFSGNFTMSNNGYVDIRDSIRLSGAIDTLHWLGQTLKKNPRFFAREIKQLLRSNSNSWRWRLQDMLSQSLKHWRYSFLNVHSPLIQDAYQRSVDIGAIDFFNAGKMDYRKAHAAMIRGFSWFAEYNHTQQQRFGVETRSPALDQDLATLSLQIPGYIFAYHGENRALSRAALQRILPSDIIELKQRGYQNSDWPSRLQHSISDIQEEVSQWTQSGLINELIDVKLLNQKLREWDCHRLPKGNDAAYYTHAIPLTVNIGKFIRVMEQCE